MVSLDIKTIAGLGNAIMSHKKIKEVIMKYFFLVLILFLSVNTMLYCVIDKYEMSAIAEMMESVGMTLDDVNFAKSWSPSAFTIPIMQTCLDTPWAFPEFVAEIKEEVLKREFASFYNYITDIVYKNYLSESMENGNDIYLEQTYLDELDLRFSNIRRPREIMKYAEFVYEMSQNYLKQSFQNLTPEEIEYIRKFLYSNTVGGSEDAESYDFINEIIDLPEIENYLQFHIDLINKIDFTSLVLSGRYFYAGMEKFYQNRLHSDKEIVGNLFSNISFNKPVRYKSKFGMMIVGTTGNDVYGSSQSLDDDYVFIFDPGGNDTYTLNMSTDMHRPFLAIIDQSGDDIYRNAQFGQFFNALFGNIFHFDGGGNDHYFGGDLAFSGNLGSMISIDFQGWDSYIVGSRSLGSGHLGVGIVVNIGGNDYYYGTMFTQGMGGTLGFGALIDLKDGIWNNDCYHAGGKWTDSLRDQSDYYAMAQGFGFGLRPSIAGGIGLLFDESGNDKYNGGVFSQGVSYWYAMGILIDLEGNDFYNSAWYPQGSGIHLSVGFLYDESGDDHYFSKRGPGQGAGHDWGVGFLVDRGGNDTYSVDGGNGMGRANSVGVFVDSGGNDRYERIGYSNYGSSHHNFEDRGSGNIGIFLDAGGHDIYSDPKCGNNAQWVEGVYGIGRDMELERPSIEKAISEVIEINDLVSEEENLFPEDISIHDLFMLACHGRHPTNTRAKELLTEREAEFADYFMEHQLQSNDIMVQITIAEIIPKFKLIHERLGEGLSRENTVAISNTIFYIGLIGEVSYLDTFEEMLNDEKSVRFTNSIIQSLGRMNMNSSSDLENDTNRNEYVKRIIDLIAPFINHESAYRRTIAARALKNINTSESLDLLFSMRNDSDFMIRSMIIMMEKDD